MCRKLKVVLFSNVLVKVFDRVLEVLPVLDPVKDPLAAGVREGPVDPDVDALVIANVNLHKVVGSSHNLKILIHIFGKQIPKITSRIAKVQHRYILGKNLQWKNC